tara:strand:- start:6835 stop:7557 length:723 start_codon:yes stop_codon:yes gene_type:complete
MEITLPEENPSRIFATKVPIDGREIPVWPQGQKSQTLNDPRIHAMAFLEDEDLRQGFIREILQSAELQPENTRGYGGKKIRNPEIWNLPFAKLLTQRALLMFCQATGKRIAHTVDRWVNVLETGDYSAPHAHYESQGAAVYFLDLGDEAPGSSLSGKFELMDPRIPWCCSSREYCPTRGMMPEVIPGAMLLFPALLLHFVHPYAGKRPRITLAWNISEGPEPKGQEQKMAQQVDGKVERK